MTLSDKIIENLEADGVLTQDVKEFIKKLKEIQENLWIKWKHNQLTWNEMEFKWEEEIDKLAGDKLI